MPGPPERHPQRVPGSDPGVGSSPREVLVILGPTGTGKSELAITLAGKLDGELIGCDALQVYRGFDLATAKPTPEARRRVPHHLVDEVDPGTDFTLADFVRRAQGAIEAIAQRGHLPIVVGGTGLYLRGLLLGIVDAPPRDETLRDRLHGVARRRGAASLHRWLARRDPESAQRLSPGDTQRIIRALELALSDEMTWSQRLRGAGTWAAGRERYHALKIGLDADREFLGGRLDARVDRFFQAGLVAEVQALLARGIPRDANAFKGIGYREVLAALEAGRPGEQAGAEVRRSTRRYAKRQRTWFRKEPNVIWLDAALPPEKLVELTIGHWQDFRSGNA